MPVVASIEFPSADVDALFRQMDRAQKELGRSLGNAVRTAANRVALSIGTSTKVAPKHRKVTATGNTSSNRRYSESGGFYQNKQFEVYSDKSRKTFSVWAKNMREARQKKSVVISRRGLAKATWSRAAREASAGGGVGQGGVTASAHRLSARHARGKGVFNGVDPWAMMESGLDYAQDALQGGPRDVDTAMERAASAMEHLIDRQIEKKLGAK